MYLLRASAWESKASVVGMTVAITVLSVLLQTYVSMNGTLTVSVKQCNRWGAGRAVDYRIGLICRIGLASVEALESENDPTKWTIEELREI